MVNINYILGGSVMSGWVPIFDTMHGIRGEVNITVKVGTKFVLSNRE